MSDFPPCLEQRPLGIPGRLQGWPLRVLAPQRVFMGSRLYMGAEQVRRIGSPEGHVFCWAVLGLE